MRPYRFELKSTGAKVRSVLNYQDDSQALIFGVAIAKRLVDEQNGTPDIREELRNLYRSERIEVTVIDNATAVMVSGAIVQRNCPAGLHAN